MGNKLYSKKYIDWSQVNLILTVSEMCCILRISEVTALKLLKEGKIPANKCGREWRISKEAIINYLKEAA